MWKLKIREVRELARSHTALLWWNWIGSQAGQLQELAFLLPLGVTTVLPHSAAFIISARVPPMCEDLTEKLPSSSRLPLPPPFSKPLSTSPEPQLSTSLPWPTHLFLPAMDTTSVPFQPLASFGVKFPFSSSSCSLCFPPTMSKFSLTIWIKKRFNFSTFPVADFQLMPSLLRSVQWFVSINVNIWVCNTFLSLSRW